eukprot:jgi/Mesen1/5686/ME000288S04892
MAHKKKDEHEEVDYKTKAGTAWSHNYLNQKPWHPLSYPNMRRKWIAEQMDNENAKKQANIDKEFAKEQDFFKSTAMLDKKHKKKVEAMASVSFMYTRPPGYNPESAHAAKLADEQRQAGGGAADELPGGAPGKGGEANGSAIVHASEQPPPPDAMAAVRGLGAPPPPEEARRKRRVKDVFGRTVATAEEFPQLKNAPRVETGVVGRVKPFGIEVRNVKCARCGAFGHQSGDRECPMRDAITEHEVARQQREDPLSVMMANEPIKWKLKQQYGGTPPRGGFRPDDPNQQILAADEDELRADLDADEDDGVVDEYGGFLKEEQVARAEGGAGGDFAVIELARERLKTHLRKEAKREKREEKRRRKEEERRKKGRRRHSGEEAGTWNSKRSGPAANESNSSEGLGGGRGHRSRRKERNQKKQKQEGEERKQRAERATRMMLIRVEGAIALLTRERAGALVGTDEAMGREFVTLTGGAALGGREAGAGARAGVEACGADGGVLAWAQARGRPEIAAKGGMEESRRRRVAARAQASGKVKVKVGVKRGVGECGRREVQAPATTTGAIVTAVGIVAEVGGAGA